MLSISPPISPGDNLTHYFTGHEDYYMSSPGQWQGQGAEALGLAGTVTREQFSLVSYGYHPTTGEQLVGGKNGQKVAGNDLTFSAPKSVSIAAAFDDNIIKLHEKAVKRVVDYIEQNYVCARHQVDGQRGIERTGKLVAAKFTHQTSREFDPHLHTHVFAFNMTQRQDGEWRALYNKQIFENKKDLGKLYRNELAAELQKSGYRIEITNGKEGFFRLKEVPSKLEDHFSKRRKQVKAKAEELKEKYPNLDKAALYQVAALGSRAAKKQVSTAEIKDHWRRDIKQQGVDISRFSRRDHKPKPPAVEPGKMVDRAARALTETDSILRQTKTLAIAASMSFGQHSLANLNKAFQQSSIIKIGTAAGRNYYTTPEILSVEQGVVDTAKAGIGKRQPIANKNEVAATVDKIEQKNGWQYTFGQKSAINALATSRDRVLLVQGDAGTGKTAALSVFSHLAREKGHTVRGLGFTGKAADELRKGAGVQAQTIDSFLLSSKKSAASGKEIWLVDESSMAGSRHYAAILDRAKTAGATVAFIGDRKQFSSIAAGNMFQDLQKEIGTHAELTQVMRQKTPKTKAVVSALNQNDHEQFFRLLEKQNNLKEYKSQNDLRRAAVQHYIRHAKAGRDAVIVTQQNIDKNELNKRAKAELVRAGLVEQGQDHQVLIPANMQATETSLASSYQPGQTVTATKSMNGFRAGEQGKIIATNPDKNTITIGNDQKQHTINLDRHHKHLAVYNSQSINLSPKDKIVFLKNDKQLGVKNGQTGEIKSIDKHGNVEVKTDQKTVRFSLSSQPNKNRQHTYPYIDHGMAMTAHKTQGATVDHVVWHAPTKSGKDRQINRETTYVAATRSKRSFAVLTDDKDRLQDAATKHSPKNSVLSILKENANKYKVHRSESQKTGMGMEH